MPWGWECRSKLIKQVPPKPIQKRKANSEQKAPGPNQYETPPIFCGKGFSKIKRAPAYSFGVRLQLLPISKTVAKPNAPLFNVRGIVRNGCLRVTHGVVASRTEPVKDISRGPGPAAYAPRSQATFKMPPAYTMRIAAKPPYQAWDQWTPPTNMYLPYIPMKSAPAYSLGYSTRRLKPQDLPGPGQHMPNFNYVKKNMPAYSFRTSSNERKLPKSPAPNAYCSKKFMMSKPSIPAPSFGIRHSPYRGKQDEYLKTSKLDLVVASDV